MFYNVPLHGWPPESLPYNNKKKSLQYQDDTREQKNVTNAPPVRAAPQGTIADWGWGAPLWWPVITIGLPDFSFYLP